MGWDRKLETKIKARANETATRRMTNLLLGPGATGMTRALFEQGSKTLWFCHSIPETDTSGFEDTQGSKG